MTESFLPSPSTNTRIIHSYEAVYWECVLARLPGQHWLIMLKLRIVTLFSVFLEPLRRESCCANAIGFIETRKRGGWGFCRSAESQFAHDLWKQRCPLCTTSTLYKSSSFFAQLTFKEIVLNFGTGDQNSSFNPVQFQLKLQPVSACVIMHVWTANS